MDFKQNDIINISSRNTKCENDNDADIIEMNNIPLLTERIAQKPKSKQIIYKIYLYLLKKNYFDK